MHAADLIKVTLAGTAAIVCPGPDFLIVTRNSLLYSKRVGVCTAFGIFLGVLWWVSASVAGVSLLVSTKAWLFDVIKWAGAAYLIWIGLQAFRAGKSDTPPQTSENAIPSKTPETLGSWGGFRTGLLTNALNPKAALFFLSFFSVLVQRDTPPAVRFGYGFELSIIALIWFCLVAAFFSTTTVRLFFERISVWFARVTGAIFIVFGVSLAFTQAK